MAKEGLGIVIGSVLSSVIMLVGSYFSPFIHIWVITGVIIAFTIFTIAFFRDPDRKPPGGDDNIISPADGKVIEIVEDNNNEYMRAPSRRISVFLNIFNVHVNRIPITGSVEYFHYQKGAFLKAYKAEASDVNEQTVIGVKAASGRRVLFKQIAGLIARRIVCDLREGHAVQAGERFGMIKFGSRVDIFVPMNVDIRVRVNEKVRGGETVLGVFNDEIQ